MGQRLAGPLILRIVLLDAVCSAAGLRLSEQPPATQGPDMGKGQERPPSPRELPSLPRGIEELLARPQDGAVCMKTSGQFMGRLSNTVKQLSEVLNWAMQGGVPLQFPSFYTRYMDQEGFGALFGKDPVCPLHEVQVFKAICNRTVPNFGPNSPIIKSVQSMFGRCFIPQMLLDTDVATSHSVEAFCGCQRVVEVNISQLLWSHNLTQTHGILKQRYWQHQSPKPAPELSEGNQSRVKVNVHVRLGDVETDCLKRFSEWNCEKHLAADSYVDVVMALARVLPPVCMEVNLFTDGRENSTDIQHIMRKLRSGNIDALAVYPKNSMSASRTFASLVTSDILVFGSSGFGHLAAMFAQNHTAKLGALQPKGYDENPFRFLDNITTMLKQWQLAEGAGADLAKAATGIAENLAVQRLARECRAKLGAATP